MKKKAFTLIELLVVIAIIAILAAILFPVFAQAKLAAKKTVALSNAKNLGLAEAIYQTDFDDHLIKEYFGFPGDCSSWGSTYYSWRYAINPYTKNNDILRDPTNPFASKQYDQPVYTDGNAADTVNMSSNYAVNNAVIGFANGHCAGPWTPEGLDTTDGIPNIAGTIMIVPNRSQYQDLKIEFVSQTWNSTPGWCLVVNGSSICPATGYGPVNAVAKGASFVWCDTHAKFKNVLQTVNPGGTTDDWDSQQVNNPRTGVPYTQAERQDMVNTAYPEYK